jgi:hypothetical protein
MQTQDKVDLDREPEPRSRGLLIAVAAAVVLVLIGAVIYFRGREETPVVTQPPEESATPVEIATAFLEAYSTFDVDEAFTYLAADVVGLGTIEEERLSARFLQAIGDKTILGPCEETGTEPTRTVVHCTFDWHQLRSDEIGLGPYEGDYDITIEERKVVAFSIEGSIADFSPQIWEPFAAWVQANHPDDVAVMYDPYPTGWRITEESISLWEQRNKEWVAAVQALAEWPPATETATGFVEAYAGFDTEAATSYLAENANVTLFQNQGEDWQAGNRFMEATGFQLFPGQCEELSTSPTRATVRCPFDYHALGSDQIGMGPFTDSYITVTVEGGEIVSAVMVFEYAANRFSAQMWEPFAAWIRENHPEDIPTMYEDGDSQTLESHSDESTALWAERIAEYVEVVRQTSP